MRRICLLGLVLAFFWFGAFGCGDSSPQVKKGDPIKDRLQAQKDNNHGKYMMPKGVKTTK